MAARFASVFLSVILAITASFPAPEIKKTRLLAGAGLRVVQCYCITWSQQVAPTAGVFAASPGQFLLP